MMSVAKLTVDFENIEKIAAFLITPNNLGIQEKITALQEAGHTDLEIDIGSKMATQACLTVIFSRSFDNQGFSNWKRPADPIA